eukprot:TRINITY_DN2158_c0_g1_i1.p1 TRINITY_DN2158_c0_g1~~TRINITY_DN2158_c0_g1_i1.p1  ORF type:complete len:893 (+),score=146.37 TRINITY_DN2158_c0_g1_i1:31-2679(+)
MDLYDSAPLTVSGSGAGAGAVDVRDYTKSEHGFCFPNALRQKICGVIFLLVVTALSGATLVLLTYDEANPFTPSRMIPPLSGGDPLAALKEDLSLIVQNARPLFLRLAWHSSGTFIAKENLWGSNGATMRFPPESTDGANAGLNIARDLLESLKDDYPSSSYADIYTLAGHLAVDLMEGPQVPHQFGRIDVSDDSSIPPNGLLPPATLDPAGLREIFGRQGFNDQEIVALSGAHTVGECHVDRSGHSGPWTINPLHFDNGYFKLLLEVDWVEKQWDGPLQFEPSDKELHGDIMMLPSDLALIEDPDLKGWVELYASDEQRFFEDFTVAFAKLTSNGCPAAAVPAIVNENTLENDLVDVVSNAGPLFLRLAWHSSGTYIAEGNQWGSNGATMRFPPESTDGANAGLQIARDALEPIKKENSLRTYADIFTLAGHVAVEVMGGPRVPHNLGRTDISSASGNNVPPNGLLPPSTLDAQGLRDIFGRQGFNDQEIVALSGAHTVGECHIDRSGHLGPWTSNSNVFDNSFFLRLLDVDWVEKQWDGPKQFEPTDKEKWGNIMMLPSDLALIEDPDFRTWVKLYAENEQRFFDDFKVAFAKLTSNGCPAAAIPDIVSGGGDDTAALEEELGDVVANAGPLFVRLAWHSSGTYDGTESKWGSNGATMRFPPESTDGANAGLNLARDLLESVKEDFPSHTYADIYTLAGHVAVSNMAGPMIPHNFGRTDVADGSPGNIPPNGLLPPATLDPAGLRQIFGRQGFNDQEIVALSGAHTLGECHADRSGYIGPWTKTPFTFNNEFFVVLLGATWVPKPSSDPLQYQPSNTTKWGDLMMLPSDLALLDDSEFLHWVEIYASDEQRFFDDFTLAFAKLTSNGCPAAAGPSIVANA